MRYRVGGWVKNGNFQRYVIMQWPLNKHTRNVVILPPESGDQRLPSDEEDIGNDDEDVNEVAGEVELDESDSDSEDEEQDTTPAATGTSGRKNVQTHRWRKRPEFSNPIVDGDVPGLLAQHPELEGKTEFQTWKEIFDDHILSMILEQTTLYATRDKGVPNFDMKLEELYKLLAIVLFSGYHHLPSERDYWSTQPDLGVPFVSQMMTRNEYLTFKSYLHLADNNNLEVGNKMAKVAPLYQELNKNVRKFGFFHSQLSIDESMVPYFGKHSAKMFIRMKPVRFGYKIWFLTSSDGYPYAFDIYTGRSVGVPRVPLGFHVVDTLLSRVRELSRPENHTVYFDNFFTSCGLMRHLHEEGFKATGTVRQNRTDGANTTLISDKDIKKMPRGSYDYTCDGTVCVVKWNDNAVVCLASNSETHLPEQSTNRRVGRELKRVTQPMLISKYNKYMGGVDLLDEYLSCYRPTVRGKKWWWPLFTNALNLSVVAAFKIHRLSNPEYTDTHLEFRRNIVLTLSKLSGPQHAHPARHIAHMPVDVRYDGRGHDTDKGPEGRCVVCAINTKNKCVKCGVRLHYSRGKNCFAVYHTRPE